MLVLAETLSPSELMVSGRRGVGQEGRGERLPERSPQVEIVCLVWLQFLIFLHTLIGVL